MTSSRRVISVGTPANRRSPSSRRDTARLISLSAVPSAATAPPSWPPWPGSMTTTRRALPCPVPEAGTACRWEPVRRIAAKQPIHANAHADNSLRFRNTRITVITSGQPMCPSLSNMLIIPAFFRESKLPFRAAAHRMGCASKSSDSPCFSFRRRILRFSANFSIRRTHTAWKNPN